MLARRNEIILEELEEWRKEGSIDEPLYRKLSLRYTTPVSDATIIIRWVLIFGAIALGGGLVLLFSDVFRNFAQIFQNLSDLVIVLTLSLLTVGFYLAGHRLTGRRRRTFYYSGRALIFVGAVTTAIDMMWIGKTIGQDSDNWPGLVAIAAIIYFIIAYLTEDLLLLTFGIVAASFWYGSETSYLSGWSSYWFGMNYPIRFIWLGLLLVWLGTVHEHRSERTGHETWRDYSRIYLSLGLACFLGSLWLVSLVGNDLSLDEFRNASAFARVITVLIFTIVSVGVVMLGAKRHDKMFIGYGAVFLCLDIYTRFFEHFWNTLSRSIFFIALGALSLGFGIFWEYSRRNKLGEQLIDKVTEQG